MLFNMFVDKLVYIPQATAPFV
ncbi:MAG: hypothetical protein RL435_250, partial [Actinomycetota bacterium]